MPVAPPTHHRALRNWARLALSLSEDRVLFANQDIPRPKAGVFATVFILGEHTIGGVRPYSITPDGATDEQPDGRYTEVEQITQEGTLSVQVFGAGAWDYAARLEPFVRAGEGIELLRDEMGSEGKVIVSHAVGTGVRNLTASLETTWDERYVVELIFRHTYIFTKLSHIIEEAVVTATIEPEGS